MTWLATASAVLCGIEIFHPAAFDDKEVFADLPTVSNLIGITGFGPIAEVAFGVGILSLPRHLHRRGVARGALPPQPGG